MTSPSTSRTIPMDPLTQSLSSSFLVEAYIGLHLVDLAVRAGQSDVVRVGGLPRAASVDLPHGLAEAPSATRSLLSRATKAGSCCRYTRSSSTCASGRSCRAKALKK